MNDSVSISYFASVRLYETALLHHLSISTKFKFAIGPYLNKFTLLIVNVQMQIVEAAYFRESSQHVI